MSNQFVKLQLSETGRIKIMQSGFVVIYKRFVDSTDVIVLSPEEAHKLKWHLMTYLPPNNVGQPGPHAWEPAPIDLDTNWICQNCGKKDFGQIPDNSHTCTGSLIARIEAESQLVEEQNVSS